jgi:hypothetical protein
MDKRVTLLRARILDRLLKCIAIEFHLCPYPFVASSLTGDADRYHDSGMKPSVLAAKATACAWLPLEAAMTFGVRAGKLVECALT